MNQIIGWLANRINALIGLPIAHIWAIVDRLGEGRSPDEPPDFAESYGGLESNLNHVAASLHQLDQDGTTVRLWRTLYRRWPLIRELYAECFGDRREPSQADDTESGDGRRRCYQRDHTWLKWKNEGMTPAQIRDRWNQQHSTKSIGTGKSGYEVVKQGLRRARKDRAER